MTETPKIVPIHQTIRRETDPESDAAVRRMDIFSELYTLARVRGQLVAACEIPPQQGLAFEKGGLYLHVVQQAPCRLRIAGSKQALLLQPAEVVALTRGQAHRLDVVKGPDGDLASSQIITAALHVHDMHGQALINGLPDILHVRSHRSDSPADAPSVAWIPMTIAAIELELARPAAGREIMLSKAVELLFVWTIRHHIGSTDPSGKGWLAGLKDMTIHRTLSLMHADPRHEWRISELANLAGQSRSSFAQKFLDVMGETPMRYLSNWRMQLAGELLTSSSLRVAQIAERVGYSSQAAFGRVFRRSFGLSPTEYRNEAMSRGLLNS